jgi:hypothetical protein
MHTCEHVNSRTSNVRAAGSALATQQSVDRRTTTSRPGSIDETSQVPKMDYEQTRVYPQASTPPPVCASDPRGRAAETRPVLARGSAPSVAAPPAPMIRAGEVRAEAWPEVRAGSLPHPRLVRRPRATPMPMPVPEPAHAPLPRLTLRPTFRDHDFEEEPTGEVPVVRSRDVTRPRDVTAMRSRR